MTRRFLVVTALVLAVTMTLLAGQIRDALRAIAAKPPATAPCPGPAVRPLVAAL